MVLRSAIGPDIIDPSVIITNDGKIQINDSSVINERYPMRKPKASIASVSSGAKPKRRKDARPGEIIDAGLQEFARNGFAATRLEDVAGRAGISKGTIYRYFDDKEALFLAAVRSHTAPTFDQLDHFVESYGGSTRELLIELFTLMHRKLISSDLHILMRIVISEGRNFPELTRFYYQEGVSKGQAILKRIVERGVAAGELRPGAATDLPIVMIAPAIMAAVWRMTFEQQQPIDLERILEAHVDLVLNGVMAEKPGKDGR